MRQLLQRLDTGETRLVEVPAPSADPGHLVVTTRASVISAGTERMLVEFGKSNLLSKIRSQPDKVQQVLRKLMTDGAGATLEAVRSKLSTPIPLGYCQAGVVTEVGAGTTGFEPGDRVVTNGPHAEAVRVPRLLAARLPDGVPFEQAAFAPLAAIGLHGLRLAEPTLGEVAVVYGLGLVGLLSVQVAVAAGCRVIGIDRDADRLALARGFGAETLEPSDDPVAQVRHLTNGLGADLVLLTLASTDDGPVGAAAEMSRQRGRIVLVGVTGLSLSREPFYRKELRFMVSCSYGPGRYDPEYEDHGHDYPAGFVRWTEQRNFEAVLQLMATSRIRTAPLVSHTIPFKRAPDAYEILTSGDPSLGIVLSYSESETAVAASTIEVTPPRSGGAWSIGVLGAGNFAVRTLLPALVATKPRLRAIASVSGTTAALAAERFGFERAAAERGAVLEDDQVNAVFVLTRHDSHASLATEALERGKHVFVEKPLALSEEDVERVVDAARRSGRILMVGFNRRFAPLAVTLRQKLQARAGPAAIVMTINAGSVPRDHWTHRGDIGGGRILGEGCHFIDLARSLVGHPIVAVDATTARDAHGDRIEDISHITLRFEDGSTAVVHYLANGHPAYPKERIEVFYDGRIAVIDNWRRLRWNGDRAGRLLPGRGQDKGHSAAIAAFAAAVVDGGPLPVPLDELADVSRWTVRAALRARGVA